MHTLGDGVDAATAAILGYISMLCKTFKRHTICVFQLNSYCFLREILYSLCFTSLKKVLHIFWMQKHFVSWSCLSHFSRSLFLLRCLCFTNQIDLYESKLNIHSILINEWMNESIPKYPEDLLIYTHTCESPAQGMSKRSRFKEAKTIFVYKFLCNKEAVAWWHSAYFTIWLNPQLRYIKRPLECFQFSFITICCFRVYIFGWSWSCCWLLLPFELFSIVYRFGVIISFVYVFCLSLLFHSQTCSRFLCLKTNA